MSGNSTRAACVLGMVLLHLSCRAGPSRADDTVDDRPAHDCGTVSLYYLLALEGRSTPITTIASRLPSPGLDGLSMKDLQMAARACGLRLSGCHVEASRAGFDRPMLVYLNKGGGGHFVVVRPVGSTGKLVQVLDPSQPPRVWSVPALLSSDGWTGLALRPERRAVTGPISAWLATAGLAAFLYAFGVVGRGAKQGRRREPSDPSRDLASIQVG